MRDPFRHRFFLARTSRTLPSCLRLAAVALAVLVAPGCIQFHMSDGSGDLIEIHGGGTGIDWTDGCVALENRDMDGFFRRVRVGTPILILGPRREAARVF